MKQKGETRLHSLFHAMYSEYTAKIHREKILQRIDLSLKMSRIGIAQRRGNDRREIKYREHFFFLLQLYFNCDGIDGFIVELSTDSPRREENKFRF